MTSEDLIKDLQLLPHPEGGYYRETYRSEETTSRKNGDIRNVCTAIYFLLEDLDKSHLHRIQSDELWFFHLGEALEIVYITDGKLHSVTLGNNLHAGEVLYFRVPAHSWFGSKVKNEKGYSLVSCTVAPGFDFVDFEMAKREDLIREYPQYKNRIEELAKV